jgi:nitrilase
VDPVKVAAVQAAPVLLDRDETIAKVVTLAGKAAAEGARLVAFPEAFVPGYPDWVWRTRPWDADATALYARLFDQAVVVGSPATDLLAETAARLGIWLSVGVDERDDRDSTIYNTLLHFAPDGTLAARHRKLMPTGGERLVWGTGDGSTLQVVDTGFGRLGGLICWENYLLLARFHLYAQGVDVWVAPTLAPGDAWVATMRHLAREGRMFVIGVNPCIHADQIPPSIPRPDALYPPEDRERDKGWLLPGNTVIVDPTGAVMAGPVREEERVVSAELDLDLVRTARRLFDPVGHYNRPDVFRLAVDTAPRPAVVEMDLVNDHDREPRTPATDDQATPAGTSAADT